MLPGYNGTKQIIDIPGGQTISILATGPVRKLRVQESNLTSAGAANNPVGTDYSLPNDGSAAGFQTLFNLPAGQVLTVPDDADYEMHGSVGTVIGNGPSVNIGVGVGAATTLLKIKSQTGAATSIIVEQFY